MSTKVKTVVICRHCGAENTLVAVDLVSSDTMCCSHCGVAIGRYDHLSAGSEPQRGVAAADPSHRPTQPGR